MRGPTLSIVLPAYDEVAGIADAVLACSSCGARLVGAGVLSDWQVVVVDDGSTDGTATALDELARAEPRLHVVHHDRNRGLGAALRSGFDASTGDMVFYTDADLPVDLVAVDRSLGLLSDGVDAVSAYRTSRRGEGPRRFTYSLVYNSLCRLLFGLPVRDVNFASKLFRTDQLRRLDLRSEGSFIDVEVLAKLHRAGCSIEQFPADYRPRSRGVSTLSSWPVVVEIIREMVQLTPAIRRTAPSGWTESR